MGWQFDKLSPELQRRINELNHAPTPRTKLPNPKPERDATPALDKSGQGKEESLGCPVVRFIGYRVRPLDSDNFAGSVKGLLDGLRHAQIISGDEWWRIKLETSQVKVRSYKEEKTVIEVELP